MMVPSKNNKEMIVVNFKEIPETICVETRFITPATAKTLNSEHIFYMTTRNGNMEFTKNENPKDAMKKFGYPGKKSTVTVSIRQNPVSLSTSSAAAGMVRPPTILNTGVTNNAVTGFSNNTNDLGVMSNLKSTMPTVSAPLGNIQMHNYNIKTQVLPPKPKMRDTGVMTNPRPRHHDQYQQTNWSLIGTTQSIAIQCQMDDDLENIYEWPETVESDAPIDPPNVDIEKEEFLEYVKENSTVYSNNLRECLVCGEVSKNPNKFYGHMAIHRGPKVLCFKCGQTLDHQALLKKHYCQHSKLVEKTFLRCPHYCCGTMAISRLELYDHINEHTNFRIHKCSACHKSFCTTQEFLRHLLLRAKCYTGAKRSRYRLYGLESHKDRLCRVRVFTVYTDKRRTTLVKTFLSQRTPKQKKCKICLKSYRNNFVLNRHYLRCLGKFQKRLSRKAKRSKARNL